MPPEAFRKELEAVKDARRELKGRDNQLARRQSWLEQGIEYTETAAPAEPGNGTTRRTVPPEMIFEETKTKPTVRQAVALVMIASQPERLWRPAEVIEEIDRQGWLPRAKTAHQMVRNRMISMLDRGELVKRDPGGYYQLAPEIRNTGLIQGRPDER
jgi:hypothetical protein